MKERLCFVQLLHPGGEHKPDAPGLKRWNRGDHRRKFLRVSGRELDAQLVPREEDIVLWGEWEPDSQVIEEIKHPRPEHPQFVYAPFLGLPPPDDWRQNTDPFVFGGFHYTGCLQHTKNGPTQLRFLSRGSAILFGSCVKRSYFALDTLLVVDRFVDHTRADFQRLLRGKISSTYRLATIDPWYSGDLPETQSHRLYFGASYEDPLHGMFSFFPCLPAADAPHGFARPKIALPEAITPTLSQGKRLNPQPNLESIRWLWRRVVDEVRDQGLELGVYAAPPPSFKSDGRRAITGVEASKCGGC